MILNLQMRNHERRVSPLERLHVAVAAVLQIQICVCVPDHRGQFETDSRLLHHWPVGGGDRGGQGLAGDPCF